MTGRLPPALETGCSPCRSGGCLKAGPLDWVHSFWVRTGWRRSLTRQHKIRPARTKSSLYPEIDGPLECSIRGAGALLRLAPGKSYCRKNRLHPGLAGMTVPELAGYQFPQLWASPNAEKRPARSPFPSLATTRSQTSSAFLAFRSSASEES